MAGGLAADQQPREPERTTSQDAYVHAVHVFANDPEGQPPKLDNDMNGSEPVDNLAAPVGIITAVIVGLLLWAIILLVIVWLV
jgi:hypothetical protein